MKEKTRICRTPDVEIDARISLPPLVIDNSRRSLPVQSARLPAARCGHKGDRQRKEIISSGKFLSDKNANIPNPDKSEADKPELWDCELRN